MKHIVEFVKNNFMSWLISIIFYQSILTIFFFSDTNLKLLGVLFVMLAGKIIFVEYKDKISSFIKEHIKKNEK